MRSPVEAFLIRRIAASFTLASLATACGNPDADPDRPRGGSSQGAAAGVTSVGGAAAGSAGGAGSIAGAVAGGTTGVAGDASQGGSGGELSGNYLKLATYMECDRGCALVKEACPDSDLTACAGTCRQQADNYAATGKCGVEQYGAQLCVNSTQTVADITCTANGPEFAGCQLQIAAYYACVGG